MANGNIHSIQMTKACVCNLHDLWFSFVSSPRVQSIRALVYLIMEVENEKNNSYPCCHLKIYSSVGETIAIMPSLSYNIRTFVVVYNTGCHRHVQLMIWYRRYIIEMSIPSVIYIETKKSPMRKYVGGGYTHLLWLYFMVLSLIIMHSEPKADWEIPLWWVNICSRYITLPT